MRTRMNRKGGGSRDVDGRGVVEWWPRSASDCIVGYQVFQGTRSATNRLRVVPLPLLRCVSQQDHPTVSLNPSPDFGAYSRGLQGSQ